MHYLILLGVIIMLLVGCGSDETSPAPTQTKAELSGSYFGAINQAGVDQSIELVFTAGEITSVKYNGILSPYTAIITPVGEANSFSLEDNLGGNGGLFGSADGLHYAFITDPDLDGYFDVGFLTRDADELAVFELDDYVGEWSGIALNLASDIRIADPAPVSFIVDATHNISGAGLRGDFTGAVLNFRDANLGVAKGKIKGQLGTVKTILIMSTDKTTMLMYGCFADIQHVDTCSFSIVSK